MTKITYVAEDDFSEEDPDKLMKAITCLRGLVEAEKYLKVRKDDNFMLRYLRSSQYDPEIAFRKMQTYYSLKSQYPNWYITDEKIDCFESELANHVFYLLEERDRFGKRIYIHKLGELETSKTSMQKLSQVQDLFLESILDEEETQKSGLSVVVDLKNFPWGLLKWLTPSNLYIGVKKIESYPLKKLEFHVVNTSALLNIAIKLIWPFLSAKTKENIHFHYENWASLHKIIDPKVLPKKYGGTKTNLNVEELLKIIPRSKDLSENLCLGYAAKPKN